MAPICIQSYYGFLLFKYTQKLRIVDIYSGLRHIYIIYAHSRWCALYSNWPLTPSSRVAIFRINDNKDIEYISSRTAWILQTMRKLLFEVISIFIPEGLLQLDQWQPSRVPLPRVLKLPDGGGTTGGKSDGILTPLYGIFIFCFFVISFIRCIGSFK